MLIISIDAVSDGEFQNLIKYPAFSGFAKQAAVFRDVSTVFLSNTYPVHTSVSTGKLPRDHGLTSNTVSFPVRGPRWNFRESGIKSTTIWQAAAEKGIRTAAVLWPVTGFSKAIKYNIPEVIVPAGKNQVSANLRAGSKLLQLRMLLKHGKLIDGLKQPALDNFSAACMADILRKKKPDLALLHLTAYDTLCHKHGKGSDEILTAFEALNRNLDIVLEAAGPDRDVIIFSDHNQIDVHSVVTPNDLLVGMGLLEKADGKYAAGGSGCHIDCCGGSAFFIAGTLDSDKVEEVRQRIGEVEGFRRFLTKAEMEGAGRGDSSFGFCAEAGYCYEPVPKKKRANHGYPLDMPDSTVFYMVRGAGFAPGEEKTGGSLLDIAPIVARCLRLDL